MIFRLLVVAAIALSTTAAPGTATGQASLTGRWVGQILINRAVMPMEIEVSATAEEVVLYLPELIDRRALKATRKDGGLAVELPFGLGNTLLSPSPQGHVLATAPGTTAVTLRSAPRLDFVVSEVIVPTEGGPLPATLYMPAKASKSPAILLAGGATAQSRHHGSVVSWCHHFVRRNLACLVTDRRPDGSGGQGSDIERDARELRAALRYLRARPEVEPARTGIASFSRGTWPALRVASLEPDLSFLFMTSAAALSPGESEKVSAHAKIAAAKRSPSEVASVDDYYDLYFAVAAGRKSWEALDQAARAAESAPWGKFVDQPLEPAHLNFWRRNGAFSNAADMARIKVPILAMWGGDDLIVPPAVHEPLLRKYLTATKSLRAVVFPGGDHPIEVPPGTDALGNFRMPRRAPGLIDQLDSWLIDQLTAKP